MYGLKKLSTTHLDSKLGHESANGTGSKSAKTHTFLTPPESTV